MKKVLLLLAAVGALTLLGGGLASAVDKRCDGGACAGTNGEDYLIGTNGADRIYGRGGPDTIYPGYGRDYASGGDGPDFMRGGPDDDEVYGNTGDDKLRGKSGNDRLYGGDGNDDMHGSLDGERDFFYCGSGRDYVLIGPNDVVAPDCEIVDRNTDAP